MSEESGGIPILGIVAIVAGMFPGMMPVYRRESEIQAGGQGGTIEAKLLGQEPVQIYLDMVRKRAENAVRDGRWPKVGLIQESMIKEQEDFQTPDVRNQIAEMQTTTMTTTTEVWQGGGPLVELMEPAEIYAIIDRHTAEAKEEPGDGHIGIAAEMPEIIRQERTLRDATGYPETGFAA